MVICSSRRRRRSFDVLARYPQSLVVAAIGLTKAELTCSRRTSLLGSATSVPTRPQHQFNCFMVIELDHFNLRTWMTPDSRGETDPRQLLKGMLASRSRHATKQLRPLISTSCGCRMDFNDLPLTPLALNIGGMSLFWWS